MIRILRHLFFINNFLKSYFSKKDLLQISEYIKASEKKHKAELKVVVEMHYHFFQLLNKITSYKRALEIFSNLHIWDTELNNGVLIYIILADKKLEIVADRGVSKILGDHFWDKMIKETIEYFKTNKYLEGVKYLISKISLELEKLYPVTNTDKKIKNEINEDVVVL